MIRDYSDEFKNGSIKDVNRLLKEVCPAIEGTDLQLFLATQISGAFEFGPSLGGLSTALYSAMINVYTMGVVQARNGAYDKMINKTCHCGDTIHTEEDGFTRDMCKACSDYRCDVTWPCVKDLGVKDLVT